MSNESAPCEQGTLLESNERDQSLNGCNGKPLEQYMFLKGVGAIMDPEVIIHLGNEGLSERVFKQVMFDDASQARINGFFGIGSASVAIQIAQNHLQRKLAQDLSEENLEMARLGVQQRRLELDMQRLEFERGTHQSMFLSSCVI